MPRSTPRPRLLDIAKKAEVSVSTVFLALNDSPNISPETKQRVLDIGRQLDYKRKVRATPEAPVVVAAPTMRFGFVSIGFGVDEKPDGDTTLMLGFSSACQARGIRADFTVCPYGPASIDNTLAEIRRFAEGLEGLVLMGMVSRELLGRLHKARIPHVVIGPTMGQFYDPTPEPSTIISPALVRMGYVATAAMIRSGHRRIGFVTQRLILGLPHDRWLRGYRSAMMDFGLPAPELIEVDNHPESGIGPAVQRLMDLPDPPTAFVVPDARMTLNLINALRDRGVQPGRNTIVFQSVEGMAQSMGLGKRPRLAVRDDLVVDHAVAQLRRLVRKPGLPAVEIMIPFDAFDLPQPAEPGMGLGNASIAPVEG